MKEYIAKVAEGENLTEEEAKGAMDIMLSGDATQAQIAAFLALEAAGTMAMLLFRGVIRRSRWQEN